MYERFFGLVDAPFRLTPDPRYLFLSKKHADALAHLRLGLSESSGFVCISGDVGVGKTTLLRAFLGNLLPDITTAYVFNPALSALELLQTINSEFGLKADTESKKELVDALNAHLLQQHMTSRRSVVVIDEAQALSVDVLEQLRLLSNLETTTDKLLRIVLVGQPQLRALLVHPELVQLNQRITLRWHLGPLDSSETAAYVRHRLAVASRGQAGRVFTRPALWLVHRYSGGVPRLVNMVAHRTMLAAFADDARTVTARHVLRARREIEAVPLPARAPVPARRAAWAALGVGACVGLIVIGAGRFAPQSGAPAAPATAAAPAAAKVPAALRASVADAAAPSPEPAEAAPASAPTPMPPVETAAVETVPPAPALMPAADVVAHLVGADAATTAHVAVDALLAAWQVAPLGADEAATPEALDRVADQRGLEHLSLVGNASVLRLFDLPVVLTLEIPGSGRRYAALTALGGHATLVLDGRPTPVAPEFFERSWFGEAHLFWRDFERLGPMTLKQDMSGPRVERLQRLLRNAGVYSGPATGEFDGATVAAVIAFQQSRRLDADAQVGRLTRIVLYGSVDGYPRPTLAPATDDVS